MPEVDGDEPKRSRFKAYPLGYFHIDLAEVHTAEGWLSVIVAIDRRILLADAMREATGVTRELASADPG